MSVKLLIVSGPFEGRHYLLDSKKEWLAGRGKANSISVPMDPCLSTRHAKIKTLGHKTIVTDLNSSNGSFIEGKKLSPSKEYTFRDFLVLGSTLLKRDLQQGVGTTLTPVSIDNLTAQEKKSTSLISSAIKLSRQAKKPYIDAVCLLYAYFLEYPDIMKQVCSDFMIDPEFLKTKWKKNRFFDVPFSWLNDFIVISHSQPLASTTILTPLARHILHQFADLKEENREISQIEIFLKTPFNLIYPLLDWEKSKVRWSYTIEKLKQPKKAPPPHARKMAKTVNVEKIKIPEKSISGHSDLILPKAFWQDLFRSIEMSGQQVLLGHRGSGKSAILHRIFFPGSTILPQYKKRILYDSKVFMILNSESKLSRFVQSIIRDLSTFDLVGIDHIDHLLMKLQNSGIERGPLIQALKNPKAEVLIALDMDNRTMIGGLFHAPQIHFIGNYLDPVRDTIYESLLDNFEKKIHCFISKEGKAFIKEVVIDPSPDNIAAIKDFLDFTLRKSGGVEFPFHELSTETLASGKLGKSFLQDVYNDWVGVPKGQVQEPGALEEDPYQVFAYQLEDLVQAFSKNALKIGLHYSDQTTSLSEFRSLDKEEKLQQLKSQIVCLLTAYQHGFQRWFPLLWNNISPDELRKQSTNTRKLWQLFEEKADLIDVAYAEDQFNEATSRVFQEIYRNR